MFHQVDKRQNWKYFSITFNSFKELIESFLEKNQKFISLDDFENADQHNPNTIILTFDDGFECIYRFVAQYLTDKNIPFAIFSTVNFLDQPMYMTCEQLKNLSKNSFCTIGSHTISHPLLRKLNDQDSKNEIRNSKSILEHVLQKEVNYFAYPYGSVYAVSNRDVNYAKETGYKLAFGTINSCLSKPSIKDKWFLPRINVNELNYKKIGNYR